MKRLFKSDELQSKFEEDGFVKIHLLNAAQVETLASAYEQFRAAHEKIKLSYITTSHSSDPRLITAVDEVLQATIAPAVDDYLTDYKLLFGNYLVKMPSPDSATPPHQDITFVDEDNFVSVNIWIALQDIDKKNGSMYFLKGSHRYMKTIRPTHHYHWPYEQVKMEIEQRSVSFDAKAGDAFIFDHAVIHGSHANQTAAPRLAAVIAAYSSEAPLVHYYLPKMDSNRLLEYSMDKEAYLYFEKEKPPMKGVFQKEVEFDFPSLDIKAFDRLSNAEGKPSIFQGLKNLFK
jgi:hypothetical protein